MSHDFNYSDERFADIQMLRYRLTGFDKLTLQQKKYIYYLSEATLTGRDITTDQFGKYNIIIRKTLEAIYTEFADKERNKDFDALILYLKRLWFSNSIYHHYNCDKFIPIFSEQYLRCCIDNIDPCKLPLEQGQTIDELCNTIFPIIFDKDLLPKRVNKNDGEDLIMTSACNYYEDVSQDEVEQYYNSKKDKKITEMPSWGLNSKLIKDKGILKEIIWKEDGLYGQAINKIIYWLNKAINVAENDQQKYVIKLLIDFYKTGDLEIFDKYSIEWLKEQSGQVDFINGFIEVYGDPLGIKASWEGIVEYKDLEATKRTQAICNNAQWFEDNSPISPEFKKKEVKGVTANVICAAMLGGDEYPSTAIGINLPNADWIRASYGSKSVTIGNLTDAYNQAAKNTGFQEEFVIDDSTISLIKKYGDLCDDLHTDLHECLGHGSGQLLQGTDRDALKNYGNTIEEARADLFGLYYIADKKLIELGLVPDENAYKSQYYTYMMNGLMTQLIRINPECKIEEAHMRNRALIAHWVYEHGKDIIDIVKIDGKSYVKIWNYLALRDLFATLLAEIQRIKSEGDFESARVLVEKYAINVDKGLHKEVLERYKHLNLAPYKGFINPWMKPIIDTNGNIKDIDIDYTESYTHQMLRYSNEYGLL